MNKIIFILFFFIFVPTKADELNQYFHVGKMQSYNNNFTLYFKTRENAIIAKGEYQNYLNDYPQDLYFYDHNTKIDYPLFPEDFAYYLLNDNDTLILVSATKNFYQNLSFSIKEKKLKNAKFNGKLDFIVSSFAKNCGHKDLNTSFKCNFYKPLISKNLITSFE